MSRTLSGQSNGGAFAENKIDAVIAAHRASRENGLGYARMNGYAGKAES